MDQSELAITFLFGMKEKQAARPIVEPDFQTLEPNTVRTCRPAAAVSGVIVLNDHFPAEIIGSSRLSVSQLSLLFETAEKSDIQPALPKGGIVFEKSYVSLETSAMPESGRQPPVC